MRGAVPIVLLFVLSGCASSSGGDDAAPDTPPPSLEHLSAQGADVIDEPGSRTFVWAGELGAGASMPLGGPAPNSANVEHTFPVGHMVGTVIVTLEAPGGAVARVRDAEGHTLCAPRAGRVCTLAANIPENGTRAWPVTVTSLASQGTSYTLSATISVARPENATDQTRAGGWMVEAAGHSGAEPTLGVLDDGRVLVVAGGDVLRWDGPGKWTDVTPPVDATAQVTLDPFLVRDLVTDRVYVSQLATCLRMSWTDDGGDSWTSNPAACGGPDQHHQKIAVGPGPLGRTVHVMTMNLATWLATDDTVITHAASIDDGATWVQTTALTEAVHGFEARAIGNVWASEDGTVHAIAYLCDGFVDAAYHGLAVGRSTDMGATWSWNRIGPGGGPCEGIDPGIYAVGADVHAIWWDASGGEYGLWYATSTDSGVTWSSPETVPTPGLGSMIFADVAASETKVAIAFLATPYTAMGPNQAPSWARWFPYAATRSLDEPDASWDVVRLEDHPVQVGQVCMDGPQCLDGARNLLDFIDIQLDEDGLAHVAYPDGCDEECTVNWQSRGSELRIAIEPA